MPDGLDSLNRIERLLGRARLIIGFERLWPPAVLAAVILCCFAVLSWLGLWLILPGWARLGGIVLFAAALVGAGFLAVRARGVTRDEALSRLDRDSGRHHRPVSASQDRLADVAADPLTLALWDLHRRRSLEAAASVRLSPPSPRLVDRDPFAVRGAVVVALVAAAFVAGSDKEGRLASAFAWCGAAPAGVGFRLDAWIDPPPYTGRAPVLLSGPPGTAAADPHGESAVPVNSTVVVRWSGEGQVDIAADGGLKAPEPVAGAKPVAVPQKPEAPNAERRFVLAGDGHITVKKDGTSLSDFNLHAIPDRPPVVAIIGKPKGNLRGSLSLAYKIDDDYGVVAVEAAFSAPIIQGKPVTGRTLVEGPKVPLSLPNGARGLGEGKTTADLSANPWAGVEATIILSAHDEGGNVGLSAPITVRMPMRPFHKPLARALIEQRQGLIFDPDHTERVADALDALTIAPELFGTTPAMFLGLRAARTRLADARSDADLVDVADLLWSMALTIEDGDLSQTERDLRAMQRELKDALARGAPPEEIRKLTEALKQQMEKYLAEMTRRDNEGRGDQPPVDRKSKSITPKDLQSLLDRMEQAARNGDMAEAQQLLDQLQTILENLRSAQQSPGSDPGARQMNKSMSQLDRMMRDQQALRDKTFKRGNRHRPPSRDPAMGDPQDPSADSGEQAQNGEDGQDQADESQDNTDLQSQQHKLGDALAQLQKQMRQLGLNGEPGLGDAQQAMKDAENALGQGAPGHDRAVEAQGRALQGLQQGARGLQNQMAQGEGEGEGEGQQPGQAGMGQAEGEGEGKDPLGRDRNGGPYSGTSPQVGAGAGERARQVLEELRRRLGDRFRPQEEQDYLERLLKRY